MDRVSIWAGMARDLATQCSVRTAELDIEYVESRFTQEGESFFTTTLPKFGKDFEQALEELLVPNYLFDGFARRDRWISVYDDENRDFKSPFDNHSRAKFGWGLPRFLSGWTEQVFCDAYNVSQRERDEIIQAYADAAQIEHSLQGRGDFGRLVPPLLRWEADGTPVDFGRGIGIPQLSVHSLFNGAAADAVHAIRQLCLAFGKEKALCADSLVDHALSTFTTTDAELIDPFSTGE